VSRANQSSSSPPEGYPHELERRVEAESGVTLRIRPVLPTDAERLGEEIHNADAQTLYMRFFTPTVHLDAARLRYLTEVDYVHRLALVVFVDDDGTEGEGVAIARYEGKPDSGVAEIAVTVKENWRQAGLGKMLVRLLESAAVDRGITAFEAMYLGGNEGAAGLMQSAGFEVDQVEAGVVTVSKTLGPVDAA